MKFSTESEVRLSMRVNLYKHNSVIFQLHRSQFQYADNYINILIKSCRYYTHTHTHNLLFYDRVNSFGIECPNMSVLFRLLHKVVRL